MVDAVLFVPAGLHAGDIVWPPSGQPLTVETEEGTGKLVVRGVSYWDAPILRALGYTDDGPAEGEVV